MRNLDFEKCEINKREDRMVLGFYLTFLNGLITQMKN
jgi:hypothetical protein